MSNGDDDERSVLVWGCLIIILACVVFFLGVTAFIGWITG
jgi:hypothetical protein